MVCLHQIKRENKCSLYLIIFGLSFLVIHNKCMAEEQYFLLNANLYSEPVSIHTFTDHWETNDFKAGENAWAHGRLQTGVKDKNWDFSLVWLYDYQLKFSKDLSQLYYQLENHQEITANKKSNLYLEAQHIDALGMRIAYDWEIQENWQLTTGLSIYNGRNFVSGNAHIMGETNTEELLLNRINWLDGYLDYQYNHPALKEEKLGWNKRANTSYGYGVDFILNGRINDNWFIQLNVQDIWSYLYWSDAPRTSYTLDFQQDRRPRTNLQGQLTTKSITQKIPYKIYNSINYQFKTKPYQIGLSHIIDKNVTLWQFNMYWQPKNIQYGLHIEPQTQALGISLQHHNFSFKYISDRPDMNKSRRLGTFIHFHKQW